MWTRIRQNAVMVEHLEDSVVLYRRLFGVRYTLGEVLQPYQLRNAVIPVGAGTFLELLEPYHPSSPGARHLAQRGAHAWLLVVEVENLREDLKAFQARGVRIIPGGSEFSCFIHPSSTPGLFLNLIDVRGRAGHWATAGPNWGDVPQGEFLNGIWQVIAIVENLDSMVQQFRELFGLRIAREQEAKGLRSVTLEAGDTSLMLIEPNDAQEPLGRWLAQHGPFQYATCIRTTGIETARDHLNREGVATDNSSVPFCEGIEVAPRDAAGLRIILTE